jgi:hypothetical protein
MEIVFSLLLDPFPSSLYNADTDADLDVIGYGVLVFRMVKECTDNDVEDGTVLDTTSSNSIERAIRVCIDFIVCGFYWICLCVCLCVVILL